MMIGVGSSCFILFICLFSSHKQQELIEKEDFYRHLFVENRNSSQLNDPHVLLMDVYQNYDKFKYQPEDDDEVHTKKLQTTKLIHFLN